MENKKIIIIILGLVLTAFSSAQSITEDRTGYARAQGNIAVGYLFAEKQPAAYITGDCDVFIKNQISISGALWVFVPVSRNPLGIKANHSLMWGFNYHFMKSGRADPYIGLTPGVSLVRVAYSGSEGTVEKTQYDMAPLISMGGGCNYYVGSVFHFFIKAQGVIGEYFGNAPQPTPLYELKITAGFGLNARLWKSGAGKRFLQTRGLNVD